MSGDSVDGGHRGSTNWRQLVVIPMGLIVMTYLVAITVFLGGDIDSPKRIVIFLALWLLGLVALVLLVRAWRHFGLTSSAPAR